ncbi:MAG: HD domain-containing protein [Oscillospiraceae bacterium]|nr:HD domain-containing protein [Oscillospiraceae bacterium]
MEKELRERYDTIKSKVVERADEFAGLMDYIETETEWLTAPASTRFHLCRVHGLLEHSVNVAETLIRIKNTLYPLIEDESCVIVALLHDLGKVGMPNEPLYKKSIPTEGQRRAGYGPTYPYSYNNDLTYLSVPIRSLYLALPFLTLSEEEAQAIAYHDGQYVDDNRSAAKNERPLTLLLQYADNWCGFVVEDR